MKLFSGTLESLMFFFEHCKNEIPISLDVFTPATTRTLEREFIEKTMEKYAKNDLSEFPTFFPWLFHGEAQNDKLDHFKLFVWSKEFLISLFVFHQRLYFHFPTFLSGEQGIGKTEILICLSELYQFCNDVLPEKIQTQDHSLTIFNVRSLREEVIIHFPQFHRISVDTLFTKERFLKKNKQQKNFSRFHHLP